MNSFDFDFETTQKKYVYGIGRVPNTPPFDALCVGVHGYGEHCQRYEHVCKFMVEKNIGYVGFDLLGHGKSDGKRGYIKHIGEFFDQINSVIALAQAKFPDVPLFLYGHSMGGNLVAHFVQHYKPKYLNGVIITSAWFELALKVPTWKIVLGQIMAKIYPKYTESGDFEADKLSSDPKIAQKYVNDELTHSKMTAGLFEVIQQSAKKIIQNADSFHLPTLVMHGTDDRITSFEASKKYAEKIQHHDVHFIEWAGLRHELHNEIEKLKVLSKITNFILQYNKT